MDVVGVRDVVGVFVEVVEVVDDSMPLNVLVEVVFVTIVATLAVAGTDPAMQV